MQRRGFGKVLVGGAIGAAASVVNERPVQAADSTPPRKKAKMYLAEDHWDLFTEEHMQYLKRHGVKHVEIEHQKKDKSGAWDLDDLKRMRDLADKNDLTICTINFKNIRKGEQLNHIMLGTIGER